MGKRSTLVAAAVCAAIATAGNLLAVDRICTPGNFLTQFNAAAPGDRLILRSDMGTYGRYWLANKHGTADKLIQIIAQDPLNPPIFQSSATEGLQIASCSYMLWDGIEVRGATVEGIHLQDAGSGPSHHIIMRNVKVTMAPEAASGNTDNWKCDYTTDVLFYNCAAYVNGDCAFDMMGVVGQLVMRSYSRGYCFAHAKNGSHNVGYYKNRIDNIGERNFQFGGNGLYNYDQIAMGNLLYGASPQSVVYTTARYDEFRYNTIQNLTGGPILRVLNEGSATPPTGNNTFASNLIHYNGSALTWPGGNTDPGSFTVAGNFWSQTPGFMGYMSETGGVVGNPDLDPNLRPQNPAAVNYGAFAPAMESEWAAYTDRFAWAWEWAQKFEPAAHVGGPYQLGGDGLVTLNGLASYAGVSSYGAYTIDSYDWDLDGDGFFDDASGPTPTVAYSMLTAAGAAGNSRLIGLRVRITDERGDPVYDETYGTVEFAMPEGDVDGDGEVSVLDIVAVVTRFGATPVDANWNAACDFDDDDQISVLDVVYVVTRFGGA